MTSKPQKVEYYEVGVPYNNMKDVLDASQKQSIIFMVTVVCDELQK